MVFDRFGMDTKTANLKTKGGDDLHDGIFRAIVESAAAAQFITDGARLLYVNPGLEMLTGYTKEELGSLDLQSLFPQEVLQAFTEQMASGSQDKRARQFETQIVTCQESRRWVAITLAPIMCNQQIALHGTAFDISEWKQREDALRRSEMKYRTVFELAPDMIMIYGPDGMIMDMNPMGLEMHYEAGLTREEVFNLSGPKDFWREEDRARFEEIREQTLKYGEWSGEVAAVSRDGGLRNLESRIKVTEIEGETAVICISRDINERKAMEEQIRRSLKEKEMLLREIHHRVKNNMQIISTLLKLQLKNAEDATTRALFRESQNRILSMAMIHEKLYQSEGLHKIDLNDYINDLAHEVRASFGEISKRVDLKVEVEDIVLGMDTAIPCGLIIIELLSNALKYAFPENRSGQIYIGFGRTDQGAFELTVRDDGVGLSIGVEIDRLKSLGLRLVADLATYQLQGEMDLARVKGTTVTVRFKDKQNPSNSNSAPKIGDEL